MSVELAYDTPPEWAVRAGERPLELLSDHAHCELRAAAAAQAILTRCPGSPRLVDRLAALAMEEMGHFRRVTRVLHELGGRLRPAAANPYVEGLLTGAARTRREALLDRLLVAAVIELRSLERFALLSATLGDRRLASLYAELCPSEAGHARLFVDLARERFPGPLVEDRLADLVRLEAGVIQGLPFAPRVHSGLAGVGAQGIGGDGRKEGVDAPGVFDP